MRDYQRQKVYDWEDKYFGGVIKEGGIEFDDCKLLAAEMYGARVKVKDGRGRRNACAFWKRYPTIALPRWARTTVVIAHEVAHLKLRTKGYAAHGSQFVRVYLDLVAKFTSHDLLAMEASALEAGIRIAPK